MILMNAMLINPMLMKTNHQTQKIVMETIQFLKLYVAHPTYKYVIQVPRNHTDAVELDKKNGKNKWQDTEKAELDQN